MWDKEERLILYEVLRFYTHHNKGYENETDEVASGNEGIRSTSGGQIAGGKNQRTLQEEEETKDSTEGRGL